MRFNTSLKKLNLSSNLLEEEGLDTLSLNLITNKTILSLNLSGNLINNAGISKLSAFLVDNINLNILDLSKNKFGDTGMVDFSENLRVNKNLSELSLAKNYDITDDPGLKHLAECLNDNKYLLSLDITGIKIKKNSIKKYFEPALSNNIFI